MTPMKLSSVSILIPCYNVALTVDSVVNDAYTTGKKATNHLEIIALDDASRDTTLHQLLSLQKTIPCLRIIRHAINQGYGKTIKELYYAAKNDWLFSLPSDNQFDARELFKLLPLTPRADMILGQRVLRRDTGRRLVQSKTYNALLNLMFGLPIHDVNTIRLMKRQVIQSVKLVSDSAFVDAELAIRAKRKGFRIVETPVIHKMRKDGGATGGNIRKTILPTIYDMFRMMYQPR